MRHAITLGPAYNEHPAVTSRFGLMKKPVKQTSFKIRCNFTIWFDKLNSVWLSTVLVNSSAECLYGAWPVSLHLSPDYNDHLAITSRFLKIIDSNVKQFSYNELPLLTRSFFRIFLLVVSGTQCIWISCLKNVLLFFHHYFIVIFLIATFNRFFLSVNILTLVRDE